MSTWLDTSIKIGYAVIYASVAVIALTAALDMIEKARERHRKR